MIREFGDEGRIHFVHFRDVRGTPERFVETFHDEGQTDMHACMQAYCDVGYRRRPAHRPHARDHGRQRALQRVLGSRAPACGRVRAGAAGGGLRRLSFPIRSQGTLRR